MKLEINTDSNMYGVISDLMSAVVVAKLKEGLEDCKGVGYSKHPEDIKFNKKFTKAAKLIIKYYGG